MFNSFSINLCNLWAHSEHKSASWMNISSLPPTEPPSHLSILKSNLALRKYDGCISLPQASHIIVTFFIFVLIWIKTLFSSNKVFHHHLHNDHTLLSISTYYCDTPSNIHDKRCHIPGVCKR